MTPQDQMSALWLYACKVLQFAACCSLQGVTVCSVLQFAECYSLQVVTAVCKRSMRGAGVNLTRHNLRRHIVDSTCGSYVNKTEKR